MSITDDVLKEYKSTDFSETKRFGPIPYRVISQLINEILQ